jgi:hypothetical protein
MTFRTTNDSKYNTTTSLDQLFYIIGANKNILIYFLCKIKCTDVDGKILYIKEI